VFETSGACVLSEPPGGRVEDDVAIEINNISSGDWFIPVLENNFRIKRKPVCGLINTGLQPGVVRQEWSLTVLNGLLSGGCVHAARNC
jgi:hypothetical protein